MKRAWEFGKLFLFSPAKAADACAKKEALADGLVLYALLAAAGLLSSWYDPLAFLDPTAPARTSHGAPFWLGVALWETLLFPASVFFTVLALDWMRAGWLPLKTGAATVWTAAPAVLAACFRSANMHVGKAAVVALLAVWAIPALWLSRRVPAERWRGIAAFLLGLSAIQLVGLAVEATVVVPARSTTAFYAATVLTVGWLLVSAGIGLRRLCAISTARAVLAFLFALFATSAVPALAYSLGLMSKDVFKVVMYV